MDRALKCKVEFDEKTLDVLASVQEIEHKIENETKQSLVYIAGYLARNPELNEDELFEKKILKKSKGNLKLLNVGELEKPINLQISYASKKAVEVVEKLGGTVKLIKK